jgi:mRNA-degrading endonuclease RelE of RelBE toxin-antitoxin system
MYTIEVTPEAQEDLRWFSAREQRIILGGINSHLQYEPTIPTNNRKQLRPNDQAVWELRIGNFRVLYNVEENIQIIEIQRVGEKRGNRFFFRGKSEDV